MKKLTIATISLAGMIAVATPACSIGIKEIQAPVKAKTWEILDTNKKVASDKKIEPSKELDSNKEKANQSVVFVKKIADMKDSPLEMKWIDQVNSLRQFLWLNQYKLIFENYNPQIVKKDKKWEIIDSKSVFLDKEIVIPRVYDWLKETFPESLDEFIKNNPEFSSGVKDSKTVLIITKTKGNESRFAMAYYLSGKLSIATHVSPWLPSKSKTKQILNEETWEIQTIITEEWWANSPEWNFEVKRTNEKFIRFKRSKKYKNAPMPYAIWITWWVFLHHWTNVDGKKRSHWCIRVPGFYQELLFHEIQDWTKIIIRNTKD